MKLMKGENQRFIDTISYFTMKKITRTKTDWVYNGKNLTSVILEVTRNTSL